MQQADTERRTGPQAGARREVAIVVQLKTLLDLEHFGGGANCRMFDFRRPIHKLDFRPHDAARVLEEWRHEPAGDVTIVIDGRGQDRAAVLPKPDRVIGPTAEKRNAIRSTADNHDDVPRPLKKLAAACSVSGVPISIKSVLKSMPYSPWLIKPGNTSRSRLSEI